jgi:cell division protein FtsB
VLLSKWRNEGDSIANSECVVYYAPHLGFVMAFLPPLPAKYKGWIAVCTVALVLFALSAIFGNRGLVQLVSLQSEQRHLEQVAFELQRRNEGLQRRIERLESDDRYIERLARRRLGLAKKGEIIYRIPETTAK